MTASEEKFTRQTLLGVQPLTPNLFTLRTSRDADSGSAPGNSPSSACTSQRQHRLARLLDGFGAS